MAGVVATSKMPAPTPFRIKWLTDTGEFLRQILAADLGPDLESRSAVQVRDEDHQMHSYLELKRPSVL